MATAKKSSNAKSKSRATKSGPKLSTAVKKPEQSFGYHKQGSRKSKVHELFKKEGSESAWVLGLKLKLKEGTLRSWFAAWKRDESKAKEPTKANMVVTPATTSETIAA